jgi:arylsulfatase A-like enzyme
MRLLLALLVVACLLASCTPSARQPDAPSSPAPLARAATPKDWNVILISMNNVGAEHMSLYGYKRKTTPRLDEYAKSAYVFDHAYTPSSWTLPAATSLFTSLQPYSHQVMDRWEGNLLNDGIPTLGEILKGHGYVTGAFTGGLDYRPTFGHLRGMDDASLNMDFTHFDTSFAQATRWLTYHKNQKFFLVVQGYDAHPPFKPPAPFRGTFSGTPRGPIKVSSKFALRGFKNGDKYIASYIWEESDPRKRAMLDIAYPPEKRTVILTQADMDYLRDLYDDTVLSVDSRVADFLAGIDPKVLEKTVVIIESEHGEMFGKHGRFGRAGTVRGTLYEDVVHVPLIIHVPGTQGGRVAGLTQLIDVAPTLLDLLGIPSPSDFEGKSLVAMMNGGPPVNPYAYAGSLFNVGTDRKGRHNPFFSESSENESIRDDRWKLIHEVLYASPQGRTVTSETWELYDLQGDPDEQKDVAAANPDEVKKLEALLLSWNQQTNAVLRDKPPRDVAFPPDFEQKARSGGYW